MRSRWNLKHVMFDLRAKSQRSGLSPSLDSLRARRPMKDDPTSG